MPAAFEPRAFNSLHCHQCALGLPLVVLVLIIQACHTDRLVTRLTETLLKEFNMLTARIDSCNCLMVIRNRLIRLNLFFCTGVCGAQTQPLFCTGVLDGL